MDNTILTLTEGQTGRIFCEVTAPEGLDTTLTGAIGYNTPGRERVPMTPDGDDTLLFPVLPPAGYDFEVRAGGKTLAYGTIRVLPSPLGMESTGEATWKLVADLSPETVATVITPAGPRGAKGDQGERGEKGDKGDQGERGEKGEQGEYAAVDLSFSSSSTNPQAGTAVQEAVDKAVQEAVEAAQAYVTSHTTQKVDLGELPVDYRYSDDVAELLPVQIEIQYADNRWLVLCLNKYGNGCPMQLVPDERTFPDIQIFFRTGGTVPDVNWETLRVDIHWLNTEARNVAPTLEPNMSYHLGVSYEFGHFVISVNYEESTLADEPTTGDDNNG